MPFLDRYVFERTLQQRGPVTTRLMRDAAGQRVVVKTLSVQRAHDPRDLELIEREAGILKNLDHPRVPRFVDYAVEDSGGDVSMHLVQEFVAGQTLDAALLGGRGYTPAEAVALMRDLAQIAATLHRTSPPLVHRDIKPQNIMLGESDATYLVDFGAAKRAARDGTAVGTFGYMAPEQLEGRASPASDVFGIGMTLVFALTHLHPEAFADFGGVRASWRSRANVSARFAELIDACIAIDEHKRPRDGAALLARIDALATPAAVQPAVTPGLWPRVAIFAAGAVLALLMAMAGVFALTTSTPPQPGVVSSRPSPSAPTPPTAPAPATANRLTPSQLLGVPGFFEAQRCLQRAQRALESSARYRSWRTADAAPTCHESYISYGLYSLYDDAPAACTLAHAALTSTAATRDAARELSAALVALANPVLRAEHYYDAEDYKDDACALARQLHAPLLEGFARVQRAYVTLAAGQRALVQATAPSDARLAGLRTVLDAAVALGDVIPADKRRAAVDAFSTAVNANALGAQFLDTIDDLKRWARSTNDMRLDARQGQVLSSTVDALDRMLSQP